MNEILKYFDSPKHALDYMIWFANKQCEGYPMTNWDKERFAVACKHTTELRRAVGWEDLPSSPTLDSWLRKDAE